ncbi:MAG: response regulator transcription factor [Saprospiraceae bacterium]|nr:LytTR family DNA-binding domain-containing protein [Bacteroidia bacterium]NNL91662.1 response regulator transcription factor [Saprospiraceae bacterium]
MNVLIIEDESLAAEKLQSTLHDINPSINVLATLTSVDQSIEWLKSNPHPELIFSDIHLADGICFNIYTEVKISCPIIFTTAYEKYAIQAFEVNSIDYLLKPIQKIKLEGAINKFNLLARAQTNYKTDLFQEFKSLMSESNKEYKSRFLCKLGNKIKSVPSNNISYFYSKDKITFIIDKEGHRLPINNTLDEIDSLVDPSIFFRVNRKFVVQFDAIQEIHPYFKGRLKLKLNPNIDEDIVVSTEKSPLFKSWLDR